MVFFACLKLAKLLIHTYFMDMRSMLMHMSSYSLSVSVACSPYTACLVSKRFDVYINPYIHKQILFIDFTYM